MGIVLKRQSCLHRPSSSPSLACICVQALLGWAIFGESLSLLWWFGGTLIAAGTVLVASGSAASASSTTAADTQGAASKQDAPISSRTRRKAE